MTIKIATTTSVDPNELAAVAARTFPLACPPWVPAENITSFIDTQLSAARFAEFLNDPQRAILTAQRDGQIVGYAMLIHGISDDTDVQEAVTVRPAAQLNKLYLLPDLHGQGASTTLMDSALAVAADWGVRCVWLGVSQVNVRAQRFYTRCGFETSGTRTFRLGSHRENDYVMVRPVSGR